MPAWAGFGGAAWGFWGTPNLAPKSASTVGVKRKRGELDTERALLLWPFSLTNSVGRGGRAVGEQGISWEEQIMFAMRRRIQKIPLEAALFDCGWLLISASPPHSVVAKK